MFELRAHDGGLTAHSSSHDEHGTPFYIKGVTWRGMESGEDRRGETKAPPHGLVQQSLDDLLAKLARHKFNTIRLTVDHLSILRNEAMDDYGDVDRAKNPWFAGNRYVSLLRAIAVRAAAHGVLVVVAVTRLAPTDVVGGERERKPPGLWYSEHVANAFWGWEMPERAIEQNWYTQHPDTLALAPTPTPTLSLALARNPNPNPDPNPNPGPTQAGHGRRAVRPMEHSGGRPHVRRNRRDLGQEGADRLGPRGGPLRQRGAHALPRAGYANPDPNPNPSPNPQP